MAASWTRLLTLTAVILLLTATGSSHEVQETQSKDAGDVTDDTEFLEEDGLSDVVPSPEDGVKTNAHEASEVRQEATEHGTEAADETELDTEAEDDGVHKSQPAAAVDAGSEVKENDQRTDRISPENPTVVEENKEEERITQPPVGINTDETQAEEALLAPELKIPDAGSQDMFSRESSSTHAATEVTKDEGKNVGVDVDPTEVLEENSEERDKKDAGDDSKGLPEDLEKEVELKKRQLEEETKLEEGPSKDKEKVDRVESLSEHKAVEDKADESHVKDIQEEKPGERHLEGMKKEKPDGRHLEGMEKEKPDGRHLEGMEKGKVDVDEQNRRGSDAGGTRASQDSELKSQTGVEESSSGQKDTNVEVPEGAVSSADKTSSGEPGATPTVLTDNTKAGETAPQSDHVSTEQETEVGKIETSNESPTAETVVISKKEKSTDCDSALIPMLCVHG